MFENLLILWYEALLRPAVVIGPGHSKP